MSQLLKCSSLTFSVRKTADFDPVACILILAGAETFSQSDLLFASVGNPAK